jgi:hypothetical protein
MPRAFLQEESPYPSVPEKRTCGDATSARLAGLKNTADGSSTQARAFPPLPSAAAVSGGLRKPSDRAADAKATASAAATISEHLVVMRRLLDLGKFFVCRKRPYGKAHGVPA